MIDVAKKIIGQIVQTFCLYAIGWIMLYPLTIIASLATQNISARFLIIIFLTACGGVLLWFAKNKKYIEFEPKFFKKLNPSVGIDITVQFAAVILLFILVLIKEKNQTWWYSPIPFQELLEQYLGNSNLVHLLAYSIPVICVSNFLIVTLCWLFYNLAQIAFDKRVRLDYNSS